MKNPLALLAAAALLPLGAGAGDIVRCQSPGGAVTYQQAPCPGSSTEKLVAIPTDFPEPNLRERERLLGREAELERRLEARRERELKEAAIREARQEREAELERARLAALAAAQQPQYLLVYPPRHWRAHRPPTWRTLAPRY